jgi:hypothetical protein
MKRIVLSLALAAGLAAPTFAAAQYNSYGAQQMDQMSPTPRSFSSADDRYKADVLKLRADAVKLQKADRGHLSDAHKADLQARLDALNKDACAKHVKAAACPAAVTAH